VWARSAAAIAGAALLASCVGIVPRDYANPVLDRDFPDPAVLRAPDGYYYAYATATPGFNIQVARSSDLARWEHLGDALPQKPRWATLKTALWAPHVLRDARLGKYVMYYSAEPDTSTGKCLAIAVADAPGGPFADSGRPLLCGGAAEHIDPMVFDDPRSGKRLFYWGSGGLPIKVRELAADGLSLSESAAVELLQADARPYRTLIEAPWVVYRDGTYYLFYSGDRCCAREPRYAVMVARSASALGPFEALEAPILESDTRWIAPGHNSIALDAEGNHWILYHAFDAERMKSGDRSRVMLLERIEWRDGWPRVRRAGANPGT
jgi:arabinan endo-1,5-alpha-L-arabinosidase